MSRSDSIHGVLGDLGMLSRSLFSRGADPFAGRALGRRHQDVLFVLAQRSGVTVRQLAETLGVTSGAVSQALELLTAEGLVTDDPNPRDGRSRLLRLSDEARRHIDGYQQAFVDANAAAFEALDDGELAQLRSLLDRLVDARP